MQADVNFCDSSSLVTGHIWVESYHQEIPVLRLWGKRLFLQQVDFWGKEGLRSLTELLAKKSQAGDIWHGKENILASQIHYTHTFFFPCESWELKKESLWCLLWDGSQTHRHSAYHWAVSQILESCSRQDLYLDHSFHQNFNLFRPAFQSSFRQICFSNSNRIWSGPFSQGWETVTSRPQACLWENIFGDADVLSSWLLQTVVYVISRSTCKDVLSTLLSLSLFLSLWVRFYGALERHFQKRDSFINVQGTKQNVLVPSW